MDINFTGHGIELTAAIRDLTSKKFERIHRHFDKLSKINVVFGVENLTHTAESTLHVAGADFHASASADDLYKAIDELVDKLDRQLIKHKEKLATQD
jgi:putative sigma-54 modulation protein